MRFRHSYIISALLLLSFTAAGQQNRPILSQTSASSTTVDMDLPPEVQGGSNPSYIRSYAPVMPVTDPAFVHMSTATGLVKKQEVFLDGSQQPYQIINYDVTSINGLSRNRVQIQDNRPLQEQYGFLPYATTANGLQANAYAAQKNFYAALYPNEGYTPFSKNISSNSNTQRAMTSFAPGKGQVGLSRGGITKSVVNTASEVIIWDIDGNGLPYANGFYAAGMLSGSESSAPDGTGSNTSATAPRSRVYNDRDGRTVLKMVWDGASSYKYTYYVYDEKGYLRCTITPKAFKYYQDNGSLNSTVVNNLCFLYRYDAKGRPLASQKPGEQGYTYVVYDRKNRVVMHQSPNQGPNKWELTFYDAQDRIKATSLFTDNQTLSASGWQAELDNAAVNGSLPGNVRYYLGTEAGELVYPDDNIIPGNLMMTFNWYDNYNVVDPTGNRKTAMENRLMFTEAINTNGTEYAEARKYTYGLPTGSRVRILIGAGQWRNSVVFYDKKGRVSYTQAADVTVTDTVHHDYTVTQYDFINRNVLTKHLLINNNSTDGTTNRVELTRNRYDPASGKLANITHKIDNGPWKLLSSYSYDELGRVKRKTLGSGAETQDLSYNIRDQLTGINKDYAETGAKGGFSKTFGQSIKYDFGFEKPRYDGNMAGMVWRGSASGDMMAYGYDYMQDGALKFADYNKFQINTWTKVSTDYTVKDLAYDKNGNLTAMTQRGVKPGTGPGSGPVFMDILSYNYENSEYSNRLARVTDGGASNGTYYGAGDFNDGNTSGGVDYGYDAAGNLTHDANKGIYQITYTHFDKPQTVSFNNGNMIRYNYDAAGNKIQEIVTDAVNSTIKTTDYIGNFVYEDNKLQYSLTGDGRTRYDNSNHTYKEEFFVKDHLGNVRSVVELVGFDLSTYLATYELASANLENLVFEYIDEVRDDKPGSGDVSMAANLNGADPSRTVGTSLLMHVMAGDLVSMNVDNYYESFYKEHDAPISPEDMLDNIVTTLVGGNGGLGGSDAHDPSMVDHTFTPENFSIYNGLVDNIYDNNRPKAFLNYVLFDENLKVVNTMSGAFQVTGEGGWTEIGTTEPLEIPKNGYLAVYLSNASTSALCLSCGDVYFDDMKVKISRGKLLEENHYYPHGLPIYGLSTTASGYKTSGRKYQSNEYNTELNLNWMDFNFRQYDPQIGRFLGVDPLADMYGQDMFSSYAAMGNMPQSMIDPNGLSPQDGDVLFPASPDGMSGTGGGFAGWGKYGGWAVEERGGGTIGGGGRCRGVAGSGYQYFSVTAYWTNVMNQFSRLSSGSTINIDLANNFARGNGGSNIRKGSNSSGGTKKERIAIVIPEPLFNGTAEEYMAQEVSQDGALMAINLYEGYGGPNTKENNEFWDSYNETWYNITPGLNLLNDVSKILTGNNLDGKYMGSANMLASIGGPMGRVGKVNKISTVADDAVSLSKQVKTTNIKINTVTGRMHYDLIGAEHKGVKTPHVQRSIWNTNPTTNIRYLNKDNQWVRPMDRQDIRILRNYLKRL